MTNIKLSSLNKGLVGHWTMSQDSLKGSLLGDKTPYENDGTIYGATFTTDRKGKANSAMSFDGVDDYILATVPTNTSNGFSVSGWFTWKGYSNSIASMIILIGTTHGTANGNLDIIINPGNSLVFRAFGTCYATKDNFNPISDYKHFVFTISPDGSGSVYLDGILLNSNSTTIENFVNNDLFIGRYSTGMYNFNGSIDDVRIYNRALSEEEIKTLYNSYNPNIKMKASLPKIKLCARYGNE